MPVRSEAVPWVAGSGLPTLGFYAAWVAYGGWLLLAGFAVFCALTVYFLYFFRDPAREPDSPDPEKWLAPADGIVRKVKKTDSGRPRIVIFLTIFNVHLNRMPVKAEVEEVEHTSGKCLPAYADELEEKNERNLLRCRDEQGRRFEVWQLVGALARRIYCWAGEGDSLQRGQRFGMIAFGSRTDLVLPESVEPVVEPGQLVRAGKTTVAKEMAGDD